MPLANRWSDSERGRMAGPKRELSDILRPGCAAAWGINRPLKGPGWGRFEGPIGRPALFLFLRHNDEAGLWLAEGFDLSTREEIRRERTEGGVDPIDAGEQVAVRYSVPL